MPTDLCISIAVARPDGLDPLPGAVPSARRFAAWACSQGYTVELLTDEKEPVTCARLAEVMHRLLGDGGQRRVIVSFAGHGLIRGGSEEYWLLNGWRNRATEAVNHLKLRDRLSTYLPSQLAIISDACRSLTTDRAKWVEGNGVVDVKDYVEKAVHVAHLAGTRSAQPSWSTPLERAEAYCFFTQVLTQALHGEPADVVETDVEGRRVVLNDTLFNVVDREVPLLASRYGKRQVPELTGTWRAPQNVWSLLPATSDGGAGDGLILPSAAWKETSTRGASLGLETRAEPPIATRAAVLANALRIAPGPRMSEFRSGVVVKGEAVAEVVTPKEVVAEPHGAAGWFAMGFEDRFSAPIAIRLADESWIAGAAYRDFIGAFTLGPDGAETYVLRPSGDGSGVAEDAVARASLGGALCDPYALAAVLRDQKHADPVLGALAAYAYARAGAIDDIRRLCHFYILHNQPVPFDAVLLARVRTWREHDGLYAEIPPVEARPPRVGEERDRPFTYEATRGGRVAVAGGFPWLRQGWALLEDDFRPAFRALSAHARGVRPGMFTSLHSREGRALAEAIRRGEV